MNQSGGLCHSSANAIELAHVRYSRLIARFVETRTQFYSIVCVFDTIINYDQKQIYTGKLELKSQWSVVIQSSVYSSSTEEHKKPAQYTTSFTLL